jgi:EAL domain-containing protein (putative c-di-GMP-specific phosphodiesterase class I)
MAANQSGAERSKRNQMELEGDTARDITQRLMSALQRDEFVLYAQSIVPLVAQSNDRPFQEIYVRFREEDAKLLPPGTFFPLLEECGMLPFLDRWVVNRLARWVRSGLKVKPDWKVPHCNVNLSDKTIADPKFADYVLKYLDHSYLSGGVLGFDISCESAVANRDPLRRLMAKLRPYGGNLTIAGFDGTDAMLTQLEAFDPDFIKISAASIDPAKVSEINRMCHGLGATTIAEHVENSRVLEHLRRCKIDFGQGFAISQVEPL